MILAGSSPLDPLLVDDLTGGDVLIVVVKAVLALVLLLVSVLFMVWFERKAISDLQNRIGPNRAGPFGLFQTVADGLKFFMKEDSLPDRADRRVFILAPYLTAIPAFLVFAVIPIGGDFSGGNGGDDPGLRPHHPDAAGRPARSASCSSWPCPASPSTGSCWPAGRRARSTRCWARSGPRPRWSPTRPPSASSVVTVVLVSGTLSTNGIVVGPDAAGTGTSWATGVVPFIIFLIAATAELNRPPFDLVEAEQELVGGFNTEYSRSASPCSSWPSS